MWSRLHGCQQKENRKMSSEGWTVLESNTVVMDLVITDILILSKKDRAPEHFTTVCLTFMIHSLLHVLVGTSTLCG